MIYHTYRPTSVKPLGGFLPSDGCNSPLVRGRGHGAWSRRRYTGYILRSLITAAATVTILSSSPFLCFTGLSVNFSFSFIFQINHCNRRQAIGTFFWLLYRWWSWADAERQKEKTLVILLRAREKLKVLLQDSVCPPFSLGKGVTGSGREWEGTSEG